MPQVLIYFIAGLFLSLLFMNIFFRLRVIKTYKKLVSNRVEFNSMDIFKSNKKMQEIYNKYPASEFDIRSFIQNIRFSVFIAILIILLITTLGFFLHLTR